MAKNYIFLNAIARFEYGTCETRYRLIRPGGTLLYNYYYHMHAAQP